MRRTLRIIRVVLVYLVFYNFTRHRNKFLGQRLREVCQQLGTMFMKFGQLLSLRYDILNQRDSVELQKLLDEIPPFRYDLLREVFLHDFGSYPEQMFKEFNKIPIASASIAQVHEARLKDGTKVAVKVRRPFVGKPIERDIKILRRLTWIVQLIVPRARKIRIIDVIDELNAVLEREIDLREEVRNIEMLIEFQKAGEQVNDNLGTVFLPKVYNSMCSYNILTMEFLEGIPMTKFKTVEDNPEYDVLKSARTMLSGAIRPMFEGGRYFFHADPHPGNILLMKNGDVGLLDFGIVGDFEGEFTKKATDLLLAVYTRNLDACLRAALSMSNIYDKRLEEKLRPDMIKYLEESKDAGLGFWFLGIAKMFVSHGLKFPQELTLFGRSNVIFDGLVYMIDPKISTVEFVGDELKRGLLRRMVKNIKEADFASVAYKITEKYKSSPDKINKMIERYCDNPLILFRDIKNELSTEF